MKSGNPTPVAEAPTKLKGSKKGSNKKGSGKKK
jgi:hypothetical protein